MYVYRLSSAGTFTVDAASTKLPSKLLSCYEIDTALVFFVNQTASMTGGLHGFGHKRSAAPWRLFNVLGAALLLVALLFQGCTATETNKTANVKCSPCKQLTLPGESIFTDEQSTFCNQLVAQHTI